MNIVASQLFYPYTPKIFSSSQFIYPVSWPYADDLVIASVPLHWDLRARGISPVLYPFLFSCPHFPTFPHEDSSVHGEDRPWLWGPPGKTCLWLMPSNYLLHGRTSVTKTSWRKHKVGPTDLTFKLRPHISNERVSISHSYCIALVG